MNLRLLKHKIPYEELFTFNWQQSDLIKDLVIKSQREPMLTLKQ